MTMSDWLGICQVQKRIKISTIFWLGRLKERDHLRKLGVEGKLKQKCILKKLGELMWSGFISLMEGTIGRVT
jgi:hypothetical protein